MDYQKALDVLGLKPGFTEEELKRAYRSLSHKYHPDKYEGTELYEEMQRKQQDVNAAKDYLKKYVNNIDLDTYTRQKKMNYTK